MNLYERLTAELAAAIRGGELAGGSALPPVREFARLRGIGPSTAARVTPACGNRGWPLAKWDAAPSCASGRWTRVRCRRPPYASLGRSAVALEAQDLRAALKAVAAQPDRRS